VNSSSGFAPTTCAILATLGGELPDRDAPDLTRLGPVAGEAVEHDPGVLDADHRPVGNHQRAAVVHAQEAVLRMHPEQLRRRSAEPVRLVAELVDEGETVPAQRRPLRREEVPAGGRVLGQTFELVAPGGDGGRKVGQAGRGMAERLRKRKGVLGSSVRTVRTQGNATAKSAIAAASRADSADTFSSAAPRRGSRSRGPAWPSPSEGDPCRSGSRMPLRSPERPAGARGLHHGQHDHPGEDRGGRSAPILQPPRPSTLQEPGSIGGR
jgi:hypothetical protein